MKKILISFWAAFVICVPIVLIYAIKTKKLEPFAHAISQMNKREQSVDKLVKALSGVKNKTVVCDSAILLVIETLNLFEMESEELKANHSVNIINLQIEKVETLTKVVMLNCY